MNFYAIRSIYVFEMMRFFRTYIQSLLSPVVSTSLYFIVFGSAIGSRMTNIDGVTYGAFIVPGLTMLSVLGQSVSNASFGIYMPRFTGAIYELLSAPVGFVETLVGFVGAAAAKSLILATIILVTAHLFVSYTIVHPVLALGYILLVSASFSLFGFILGIWADGFERLQIVPLLFLTPLTFLGGTFYSIGMLGEPWRTVALFNPIVYLVNGFRWAFYDKADVNMAISLGMTLGFMAICVAVIAWIFKTGYRLRT